MEKRKRKQNQYSEWNDDAPRNANKAQDHDVNSKPPGHVHYDSDGDDFVDLKPMYSIQKKKFQDTKSKSQESVSSLPPDPSDDDVVGKDVVEKGSSKSRNRKSWSEKKEELELQRVLELSKKEFVKTTKDSPPKQDKVITSLEDIFSDGECSHIESVRASSPDLLEPVFLPQPEKDSCPEPQDTQENKDPEYQDKKVSESAPLKPPVPSPTTKSLKPSVPPYIPNESAPPKLKQPLLSMTTPSAKCHMPSAPPYIPSLPVNDSASKKPIAKPSHVPLRLGLSKKSRMKPLLNMK